MNTLKAEGPASPGSGAGGTGESEPSQVPISERTRAILKAIDELDCKHMAELQDVTQTVRDIQRMLGVNDNWKSAIIRGIKQFISLVEIKK